MPLTPLRLRLLVVSLLTVSFLGALDHTVVSTSLPRIISDLGGSQSSYTWVVPSTLLTLTISTPI